MARSLTPGILSRPAPWLTAAILLLMAAGAMLFGGQRNAFAFEDSEGPFAPQSTSSASASCYETEASKQAPGGAVARCEGAGNVVYQFDPSGIPALATNIRYRVTFMGLSGGGPGSLNVSVAPAGQGFTASYAVTLTTTETNKDTSPFLWNTTWTPGTNVQVRMSWISGERVYWDNLRLTAVFDMPDNANLSVNATGPASVLQGSMVTYTVTVSNSGPHTAQSVVLATSLPAGIVHLNTVGCIAGAVPTCQLGSIPSGGSKTVTINTFAALNATGPKHALFEAGSPTNDTNPNNDDDSHTVTVYAKRDVKLCKTWEDNGDNTLEPSRTFTLRVTTSYGSFDVVRTVSEGHTHCAMIATHNVSLTIEELPAPGFVHAAGYPKWVADNGFNGDYLNPVTFGTGIEEVEFINRSAAAGAEQPQQGARFIQVCKFLADNGDTVDDSGSFGYSFRANGNAQPFAYLNIPMLEAGPGGCGKVYPADYGVAENSTFTIEESNLPAGWVNAPGYPQHLDGNQAEYGSIAQTTINPSLPGAFITFWNMHARRHELSVCKDLLENNDGDVETGTWYFEVKVQGSAQPFETLGIAAVEGAGDIECERIVLEDYGLTFPVAIEVHELPQPGFTNATGFPNWNAPGGNPQAGPAVILVGQDNYQSNVRFNNKEGAQPNAPTATPSPSNTPATPAPPLETPEPSATPVPPTSTPEPTHTPTVPGGQNNPHNPGGDTPGAPGGGGTQPSQPGNADGGSQPPENAPGTPVAQPSAPSTTDDAPSGPVTGEPTPIAPSTGTGLAREAQQGSAPIVLVVLAAMCAAAGMALAARKAVRSR